MFLLTGVYIYIYIYIEDIERCLIVQKNFSFKEQAETDSKYWCKGCGCVKQQTFLSSQMSDCRGGLDRQWRFGREIVMARNTDGNI